MVNVFPALQLSATGPAVSPPDASVQVGGNIGISCLLGYVRAPQVTLASSSSGIALAFPTGVTTAKVIAIAAVTATDLIVKVGSSNPVSLQVPAGQGILLYNMTTAQVSLNSVLGGAVQYAVGG